VTPEGRVRATIIHVDRFGNLVTNITQGALETLMKRLGKSQIRGAGKISSATEMHTTYAEGPEGSAFLLFNSSSHLEIATGKARADALLSLKSGDAVEMDLY
jgi:S-adenosylmethionine hydrolase